MSETVRKYDVPVIKKHQPDDTDKFLAPPSPSGSYPYRLNLQEIQPSVSQEKLVFHMLGDTGSMHNSDFLGYVSGEMIKQFDLVETDEDKPLFLYHLGDVVYNHGEANQYQRQFFKPFERYPSPIFAIAGNHDSDVNYDNAERYSSLDAFKAVFCSKSPDQVPFSGNSARKSMIQPNVYWTLETPLATMIGLHSNVPKYGVITAEQRDWFVQELKFADAFRPEKAVIVCLHHAPYSADINHGSSLPMIEMLEGVSEQTGIRPDIVFSGHVHNYQRFSKEYADSKITPYIVAGAGGYDGLHPIAMTDDSYFNTSESIFGGVKLIKYCENQHGFLKIKLEKKEGQLNLSGEYYTISLNQSLPVPTLYDRFVLEIGTGITVQ